MEHTGHEGYSIKLGMEFTTSEKTQTEILKFISFLFILFRSMYEIRINSRTCQR